MTLIFLFALLSTPTDRILCDLWTRALTQEAFDAACPVRALEGLRVDVYSLDMQHLCSKPAQSLPRILQDCNLNAALDQYILRIVQPAQSDLLCMVESGHEAAPAPEEIAAQCPGVSDYIIKPAGSRAAADETPFACPVPSLPPIGLGLYDATGSADDLVTYDELPLLAGKLIWFGHVNVTTCEGASGVTPQQVATPCGYLSAYDDVIAWQNQFNAAILSAGQTYGVPARLLKRMMMIESQLWPFYDKGEDGEIGIMQITDNGLDTLLRWDRAIDPDYLARDEIARAWSRNVTRDLFHCQGCDINRAVQAIKVNMPYYARMLAAFRCRAVTLNPALTGADAWRQAVVDFNGSPEYLLKVEQ